MHATLALVARPIAVGVLVIACVSTTSPAPSTAPPGSGSPVLSQDPGSPSTITAIAAGGHACALSSGGGVKCWGSNESGQLGDGSTTDSSVAVSVVGLGSGITAIAAGSQHACALTVAGGVKCWGLNTSSELGDGTRTSSSTPVDVTVLTSGVSAIGAGGLGTCALLIAGGITCWGTRFKSRTDVVAGDVTAIAVGGTHACALKRGGGIACWGDNHSGQLGNGTTSKSFTRIAVDVEGITGTVSALAVGFESTCALTGEGGVKCWGSNGVGQVGDGTNFPSRSAPVDVSGLARGVTAIASGGSFNCAALIAGGVKCWGDNDTGQLGDGTTTDARVPVDVVGLPIGVTAIASGWCVITVQGGVKCRHTEYKGGAYVSVWDDVLGLTDASPAPTGATSPPSAIPVLGWTATGELHSPRMDHTATLLNDGRVLVVGGSDGFDTLASAELYDPASGSWTAVGRMTVARYNHTTTLLLDGTVLVTGGINNAGKILAASEIFDPGAATWHTVGRLATARAGHTATLLPDGLLLVAGGSSSYGHATPLRSAELFDPKSGSWTPARPMIDARFGATATLLRNGKVLLAGGAASEGVYADEELYDPRSGSWSATGSMNRDRGKFTATLLLDGTVLVAGSGGPRSAELYDPASGSWAATGKMVERRDNYPTATRLLDGRVLMTGGGCGCPEDAVSLASAEVYDPASRSWVLIDDQLSARFSHTATLLLDGRVLLAGGSVGGEQGTLASADLFDPMSGT